MKRICSAPGDAGRAASVVETVYIGGPREVEVPRSWAPLAENSRRENLVLWGQRHLRTVGTHMNTVTLVLPSSIPPPAHNKYLQEFLSVQALTTMAD